MFRKDFRLPKDMSIQIVCSNVHVHLCYHILHAFNCGLLIVVYSTWHFTFVLLLALWWISLIVLCTCIMHIFMYIYYKHRHVHVHVLRHLRVLWCTFSNYLHVHVTYVCACIVHIQTSICTCTGKIKYRNY